MKPSFAFPVKVSSLCRRPAAAATRPSHSVTIHFRAGCKIVMEQELLIEGDFQVLGDSSSSNGVDIPQIGMCFSAEEEVRDFYKSYAQGLGFGISKLGSKKGDDGQLKYFLFGCSKNGKTAPRVKNSFYPRPCSKTDCKARINITIQNDGLCVITSIQLEHNHALSPRKSRHFRCNKVLDSQTKRKLELNDQAGITLSKSFHSFIVEAGGYENLPFDERKCRNYVAEARRLRLGNGDAEALNNYFCRMQSRNSNFFYVIDVDEDSRIRNIFWADARSRVPYDSFSDVITFDTTYLTNSYDMPFAPFVGVNHHGESILLGCGLISKEDSETFIWLFKSWLTCMRGRAPRAIITDQCKAMEITILEVFPDLHHRLCLWHIMKKLPAKFSSHVNYKLIKRNLKNIVYNSMTSEECDSNWKKLIEDFNLEKNDWLNSLYEIRHKWMPVYVKDKFWAGMSTSQRSESMNAFFDDYVHLKITLKQFIEQYDNALKSKIEKEDNSDFASFNSIIPVISGNPIEKQFQSVYTNKIFKLFQDEPREEQQRSNNLHPLLQEVGQLGSKTDERCIVLTGILKEAKKKDNNKIHEESRYESKQFHSPLKVRSRGRPPTKRKQSKIEQIVKKAKTKSQKKSSTVDKKQDELSNLNSLYMIDD
ncbi:protein FAR-RED IMPAIRED RESPONSE 1-like [Zingiber officinale]|uniref:protein FAR-RED IMPAIRED RESPONSE 1-like n=1 Tax=Zingiber officinale TaxID=94328 RepID=UPI001C4B45FC|nr:protein FAR-RED IMPAIRED RESPONSE 1-like [Zingiber officinale]